jgi:hypothetical protein
MMNAEENNIKEEDAHTNKIETGAKIYSINLTYRESIIKNGLRNALLLFKSLFLSRVITSIQFLR